MAEELNLDHFDLGTFVDYVYALKQERDALRAQLPSQGGEAVEVVAWANPADLVQDGYSHSFGVSSEEYAGREPLMTVAQHQRILAAATHPADYARLEQECERLRQLAGDRDQQYEMKVKARKQRDKIVAKCEKLESILTDLRVSLNLDDTEWGFSKQEKQALVTRIEEALGVKP